VNLPAYRGRGSARRLVFKFPPEKPGNPYSYRREHIRRYCTGHLSPQRYSFAVSNFPGFIFTEGWRLRFYAQYGLAVQPLTLTCLAGFIVSWYAWLARQVLKSGIHPPFPPCLEAGVFCQNFDKFSSYGMM